MSAQKDLKLVLKRRWYEMIESGEKKEEYRDATDYYRKKFCPLFKCWRWNTITGDPLTDAVVPCSFCKEHPANIKHYDTVTFYLGYRKDRPSMTFTCEGITIGEGKPEWGAAPRLTYYVIKLGERLK